MRDLVVISVVLSAGLAFAGDAVEIKTDALQKKPASVTKAKPRAMRVDGIVAGPEGAFAIIDGRAYTKGEGGEGFLVKEIEPNRVLIESSEGLEYLPLKPSEHRAGPA